FRTFCGKIRALLKQKDRAVTFIQAPSHKKAFRKVKKEAIRLLGFMKPKRFQIKAHYGFDDPYLTGKILAYISLIYPFFGNYIEIEPDFEEEILEGNIAFKGRIRVIYFVMVGCNLLLDKQVRRTYQDIKKIKG
ncbi:MAG: DUF2953 domain-containing protein, partial [Lachnospiraceae bacterium]